MFRTGSDAGAPGAGRRRWRSEHRPKSLIRTYPLICPEVCPTLCGVAIKPRNKNDDEKVWTLFGRFPAKLGPETCSNGSCSKDSAERAQKLGPETNYKAISWRCPGLGPKNLNKK